MKYTILVEIALVVVCTHVWAKTDFQAPENMEGFVGSKKCATCHQKQFELWQGSHHDLAMQYVNADSVLGNFNNSEFFYNGIKSHFYKRDNKFWIRTDGADGKLQDYEIRYTFGVTPLQQYLVEIPGGRLQALPIAWDSRPKKQGGQRWFHLYPDRKLSYGDTLHWTGIDQNWNYMCAECHSTNLQKKYNIETKQYETSWSEINVACEACHGPGKNHLIWTKANTNKSTDSSKGLLVSLKESQLSKWQIDSTSGNAIAGQRMTYSKQIDTCARCHSRRSILREDYVYGKAIGNTHRVSLLHDNLYYDDGQIKDEVYVYSSFLQSKMYSAGVNCNDCHDPHSLKLLKPDNKLCLRCHSSKKFNSNKHHHHKDTSQGSKCVECHMPETTYMVVDPRRDHSMRIPRPDLSDKYSLPNACIQCHKERSNQWASNIFSQWYADKNLALPPGLEAIHAARTGQLDAEKRLLEVATSSSISGIIRATAVHELAQNPSPRSLQEIISLLRDKDPFVRATSASALEILPPKQRLDLGYGLLMDDNKSVRLAAARALAIMPSELLSKEQATVLRQAVKEYFSAQQINADRPEAQMNMGLMFAGLGDAERAEGAYLAALKLQPTFVEAYINLADLYRAQKRDDDAKRMLQEALFIEPKNSHVHHAIGLLQVRQKSMQNAIASLKKAYELQPESSRYGYVYGVALHSNGKIKQSIKVLQNVHKLQKNNTDVLAALVSFNQEIGDRNQAYHYAKQLLTINPQDPAANNLVEQLNLRTGP